MLTNGKVLVTVTYPEFGNGAVVYDPAAGSFIRTGSQNDSRGYSTANLLPDGTVLITGEMARPFCDPSCSSAELYDPITGTFSAPMLTHFPLGEGVKMRPKNADDLLKRFLEFNLRAVYSGHYHSFTEKKLVFGPRTRMMGAPLVLTFKRCGQAASNSSRLVNGMR